MSSEPYIDYTPFASPYFNANAYANAILAGETYKPEEPAAEGSENADKQAGPSNPGKGKSGNAFSDGPPSLSVKGDVGVALAKLNYGIEDVNEQMRSEINQHHPLLLQNLSSSSNLSSSLTQIRTSLSTLSSSLNRLHTKVHLPHEDLRVQVERLERLRACEGVLRRAGRWVVLMRRLEGSMKHIEATQGQQTKPAREDRVKKGANGAVRAGKTPKVEEGEEGEREIELARAALTIAELDSLLDMPTSDHTAHSKVAQDPIPLNSLKFVAAQINTVKKARETIIVEMEGMVVQGLANLNQALLSTSLQTAYNLRLLPQLVSNLLADLNEAVEMRISKVFDLASIGKEVAQREQPAAPTSLLYRRAQTSSTTPTTANLPIWVEVTWRRLEVLMEDIAQCCIKVYTLEKVLKLKRDVGIERDDGSGGGGSFLEEVLKELDEKPSFTFWTTLATSFDAQSRAICNSNNYLQQTFSQNYPRLLRLFHEFFAKIAVHTETVYSQAHQSPETVLCLRSISKFESLYLSRATSRVTESLTTAFSSGLRQPPSSKEGTVLARIMLNELDSARFDPLLVGSVGRIVRTGIETAGSRVESLLIKDFSATSLIGPLATSAQVTNSSLISFLYQIVYNLRNPFTTFSAKVTDILKPALDKAEKAYTSIITLLDTSIKREISSILSRIHRVDFTKSVDPMGMGGGNGRGSGYVKDLEEKLGFLRVEILGRMGLGEVRDEWLLSLVRHAIHSFLLNASITRPLGESGKLKLTADMGELEFALNTFLSTGNAEKEKKSGGKLRLDMAGEEYRALRAFRTILFLDNASLSDPSETTGLSPLILLHHIIVLSPLQLPHQIHEWSEQEYILWIDKHSLEEGLKLLEKAVDGQREGQGAMEWRGLIKEVLKNAREGKGKKV